MSGCEATPEVKRIIRGMAKALVEAGHIDAHDIVDAIHAEIADHTPLYKSEIADIISGYGTVPKATVDTLRLHLNELKRQLRAESRSRDPNAGPDVRRQKDLQKQIDTIQKRIDTGDFAKPERKGIDYNVKTQELEAERNRIRKKADRLEQLLRKKNDSPAAKVADFLLGVQRTVILSSSAIVEKLGAAAVARMAITPAEEAVGSVLHMIPGIRQISQQAPREGGGMSLHAEASAKAHALSLQTVKDMGNVIRHGGGHLEDLYDNKPLPVHAFLDVMGRIHGALKTPVKVDEFYRSLAKRTAHARKQLIDGGMSAEEATAHLDTPLEQAKHAALAYADGQRAIFMHDNLFADLYNGLLKRAETAGEPGSMERAIGGTASRLGHFAMPIVKIPTNIAGEVIGGYALGGVNAGIRLALSKGIKNLSPEQADAIMRALKKQTIGAALLAIGYMGAGGMQAAGYYQQGDNKKKGLPEAGSLEVGDTHIPKNLVHNPALEMLQIGGMVRRIAGDGGTTGESVHAVGGGLVDEIPFLNEPVRIVQGLRTAKSTSVFFGQQAAGALTPPDLRRYAKASDPEATRKPQNFLDALKVGIPGLREDVPTKNPPRHKKHHASE
jgi:polyhydroxyalkanoate synthesis regulator phasin